MPSPTKNCKTKHKIKCEFFLPDCQTQKKKKKREIIFPHSFLLFPYHCCLVDEIIKIGVKFNTNTNFCYFGIIGAEITRGGVKKKKKKKKKKAQTNERVVKGVCSCTSGSTHEPHSIKNKKK